MGMKRRRDSLESAMTEVVACRSKDRSTQRHPEKFKDELQWLLSLLTNVWWQDPIAKEHIVRRYDSERQVTKKDWLLHLQKILGLDSLEEVLDIKLVNSKFIIHNVYSVSKQGVVILDDKSRELPHWVLSAMKCLAN
ncbi:hypothetical protein P7K49_004787, partial [Saguinus oedipus]